MRSSNNVQLLLITQVLLFVQEVGFHHTHLGCCGVPEKRNSDSCKQHICLYYYHTECSRTEEVSQSLICAMSSEDQAILTGDQQQGGSNAGENEEVVSKCSADIDNVNSNVNSVNIATETVNSNADIVDQATETVNSHINSVDLATETVNSNVGIVDPTVEKVNSDLDAVVIATETVISSTGTMDQTAEKLISHAVNVDPAAETVNSNEDTIDPAVQTVNSNVDTTGPAAETVNSNVDTTGPAAETVNSNVDTTGPATETVNSNVDTTGLAAETVNSNVDTIDPAAETVNSNVDTIDPAAETVNSNVDIIDPAAETVNSNLDTVETATEIKDAHVDHMKNMCEEDCHKDMDTELNDRLPKTPENSELENMIVQTNSNDVLRAPETVDMEENTSCDIDQSLDTAEATLNTASAEISDSEQVQYTSDDFRSPESECDMERDTDEEMNAIPENVEEDDRSASNTKSEKWTVMTSQNKKKRERKDDKIKNDRHKIVKRFGDRDTENYRNGYPGQEDDEDLNDNVRFYLGEIPSSPDGALIDDIHKRWKGNYKLLECHHGYIQWLFPIRENGMNWQAQPLQLHEAEVIKADPKAKKRVLESYKLMLDFYGMELVDDETGKLKRSSNWKPRFENLKWSSHNYLRITRILKCLGELGYEHLKKGFIQFVLKEALERQTLEQTLNSCRDYWIGTIKNDQDREELYDYIDQFEYKHFGVGAPDPVLENCSGYSGTLWACTQFCMRLVFRLAYIPLSVFWWLFAMIFGTIGKRKQC